MDEKSLKIERAIEVPHWAGGGGDRQERGRHGQPSAEGHVEYRHTLREGHMKMICKFLWQNAGLMNALTSLCRGGQQ